MALQQSEWFELAKQDLVSAGILLDSQETVYAASIYHSHQAIEKAMKAILEIMKLEIPKTHNLMRLASLITESNNPFHLELKDIQKIDNFYPKLRYPTGDSFKRDEAIWGLAVAKTICGKLFESK